MNVCLACSLWKASLLIRVCEAKPPVLFTIQRREDPESKNGPQPDEVIFPDKIASLKPRFEKILKSQTYHVFYPDDHPVRIPRAATLVCGLGGCSIVLMPNLGMVYAPQ